MKRNFILAIIVVVSLFFGVYFLISDTKLSKHEAIKTLAPTAKLPLAKKRTKVVTHVTPMSQEETIAKLKAGIRITEDGKIDGGFKDGHAFSVKETFELPLKQKLLNKKEKSE